MNNCSSCVLIYHACITFQVEEYELLGKNYYEVSTDYASLSVSAAEKMKNMVCSDAACFV